jgi:hypothetical protein
VWFLTHRAEGNIKKLPLISHKAAANRMDALKVLTPKGDKRGFSLSWDGLGCGNNRMRETEYVACLCCGGAMQLARRMSHAELPLTQTFECKPCGLAVAAEAVTGSHALIEKRYFT